MPAVPNDRTEIPAMNQRSYRAIGYAALVAALNTWQHRPIAEVVARVDLPATSSRVIVNGVEVTVEIAVRWLDAKREALLIQGFAYGSSRWHSERVEEQFILPL
jgi:hypothetical protein